MKKIKILPIEQLKLFEEHRSPKGYCLYCLYPREGSFDSRLSDNYLHCELCGVTADFEGTQEGVEQAKKWFDEKRKEIIQDITGE